MIDRLRAFGAFLYDLLVGDDWRIALAVVVALAITTCLATTSVAAWWIMPAAVALVLPYSVWRARRRA